MRRLIMKIALLTQGSRGDVEPFVRLGKTLKRRGHVVTLSAPRNFTKMIESAGLKASPVEIDIEEILKWKNFLPGSRHQISSRFRKGGLKSVLRICRTTSRGPTRIPDALQTVQLPAHNRSRCFLP